MIALVNPPNPPKAVSNKDTMGGMGQLYPAAATQRIPPLDLLYAAAVMRSRRLPVRVIDCLASDLEVAGLLVSLLEAEPAYVAIRTSIPTFEWDMQIARLVKRSTGARIIVFGAQVGIFPRLTIERPWVDAIVVGEAEFALADIVERGRFDDCDGVWYRDNDAILEAPVRPPIAELDDVPFPAWDLVPYQNYEGTALMRNLRPFVTALTSRGCPYACSYCPYPVMQGRKLRVRSPGNVAEELAWLAERLGVRAVLFRDPEFALQRERVVVICEEIRRRDLKIAWRCETRIEDLDPELIGVMADAGCFGINMGIESAEPGILKGMNRKPVALGDARAIVNACRRRGIETFCFFILGLPGEDEATALRTIEYAVKLDPTETQFTVATPYPGTGLRQWAEQRGYIENGAPTAMTSYTAAMRNEHLTLDDLRRLHRYAETAMSMRWPRVAGRTVAGVRHAGGALKGWLEFKAQRLVRSRLSVAVAGWRPRDGENRAR